MITFIGWDILRENPQILQVGDVFHQRSTSFISRNIRRFTQHPGERESFASHTAMVLYSDTAPVLGHRYEPRPLRTGVMIIESQHRTNVNPILSYANDSTDAVITRVPGLTPADHAALQLAALEYEGRPYPYGKIALHALDRILYSGRYVLRRLAFSGSEYCTALVQAIYQDAGLNLAPFDRDDIDPDKLLDYAMRVGHRIVWASSERALELVQTIYAP